MSRSLQVGYSGNARPYGQPANDAQGLTVEYVGGRKVTQVPAYAGEEEVLASPCLALTKSGAACKAKPLTGTDLCTFHSDVTKE